MQFADPCLRLCLSLGLSQQPVAQTSATTALQDGANDQDLHTQARCIEVLMQGPRHEEPLTALREHDKVSGSALEPNPNVTGTSSHCNVLWLSSVFGVGTHWLHV